MIDNIPVRLSYLNFYINYLIKNKNVNNISVKSYVHYTIISEWTTIPTLQNMN